ncbi:MAG TPA: UMP kinase [Candidatus Woesebacteria bacterium]|nr:UMP kinase [Candidatus Woesebacteria bacterium]
MKYKRVLLKLTGELFGQDEGKTLNFDKIGEIAKCLAKIKNKYQTEIAVVVGAGNIFRGRNTGDGADRVTGDYIGMMATVVNSLALLAELERNKMEARLMTLLTIQSVTEPFIRRKALSYLKEGKIVILGGGTGNPYFTTDSAAALKALELNCEVILKGSNVDGVYDQDPKINKKAKKFETITFREVIQRNLGIMDQTALALCRAEKMPIIVFNINDLNNIEKILNGERIGTLIHE